MGMLRVIFNIEVENYSKSTFIMSIIKQEKCFYNFLFRVSGSKNNRKCTALPYTDVWMLHNMKTNIN